MFWMCQRYGALPGPGGILDQDAGLMARMGMVSNLYDDVIALGKKKHGEMAKLSRQERHLLKWLMEEKLW